MSEPKKQGLGLFVSRRSAAKTAAPQPAAAAVGKKPKNVSKRWMYVGGAAVLLIVVVSSLMSPAPVKVAPKKKVQDETIAVNPPHADKATFENQWATQFNELKQQVQQLNADVAARDKRIEQLQTEHPSAGSPNLPPGVVPPPTLGGNTGGLGAVGSSKATMPPPPPPLPPSVTGGSAKSVGSSAVPVIAPEGGQESGPRVFDAPPVSSASSADAEQTASNGLPPGVSARVRYKQNPSAGMLPAGAFAPIALLNGLDAGTSTSTQSNPMPVLMNISDQATLPGSAKYRLKSCFALGTGYGDLSAERVYVRVSRLSCVDKRDRLVLSQEVSGYVVDSDGKLGLRGKVVDRQGARLGKALLAGFAQGLAGALGQAQGLVMSNLSTGTTSTSLGGSSALRASGLSGAQTAASQLAQFYLQEAQSIFPVISVDTGRTGTLVFTNSLALHWDDASAQYVKTVTPTNR